VQRMIRVDNARGLKARNVIARGEAPGLAGLISQALKGRYPLHNTHFAICHARILVSPLQGSLFFGHPGPRALPWAITFRPFRAHSIVCSGTQGVAPGYHLSPFQGLLCSV